MSAPNDFSVSLGSLNSISIPWSNGTTINYPILTSTDRTSYNTLKVANKLGSYNVGDVATIDYATSGSMNGLTTGKNSNPTFSNFNLPITTVINDPSNFIIMFLKASKARLS